MTDIQGIELERLIEAGPLIVASLALLFTVGSFWWLQARRGKLQALPVVTFGGYVTDQRMTVRLPILIRNTGARPRVVRLLRLVTDETPAGGFTMEAQSFTRTLKPRVDDNQDMVHAYVVESRGVATRFVSFRATPTPRLEPGSALTFRVEAQLDAETSWTVLGTTLLHTDIMTDTYIAWSNHEGHWLSGTEEDGRRHQRRLMARLYNVPNPDM